MDHEMEDYWKDRRVAYLLSDLSQSVFATLGLSSTSNILEIPENPAQRECILLVDGMGVNALQLSAKNHPIFSQIRCNPEPGSAR